MKFLFAPWRWEFISKLIRKPGCVFCTAQQLPDQESLICHRGEGFFIIMNRYPYNSGHLMIVPNAHIDSPAQIPSHQAPELWDLVNKSMETLTRCFNPSGFNLGMNLGKAAGAGIKDHIHLHIVPRWDGDANFMPIVGGVDVVSYELEKVFEILRKEFAK